MKNFVALWTGAARRPARSAGVIFLLLLSTSLFVNGCGTSNPHPPGTFDRAAFFADNGKNLEAVGAFESFVRGNPTDSLAAEAQFRKALTYMAMEEYPLAAVEFQIMRKDYPTSPFVEDAVFHEGRAYYEQVGRVERDVTGAYEARLKFLQFSQDYPSSPHMPEVVEYMRSISDLMVLKRLEQVKVYRQLKRFKSIAVVLDDVLAEEGGSSLIPRVLWERGQVAQRLAKPSEAMGFYRRIGAEHPDSEYAERAAAALKNLAKKIPAAMDDDS